MSAAITILGYVEYVWNYVNTSIHTGRSLLRGYLGPEPAMRYWMFENGDVVPDTVDIGAAKPAWVYDTATQTIAAVGTTTDSAPRKRLPWLSLHFKRDEGKAGEEAEGGKECLDLTDWIVELRSSSASIPIIPILRLGAILKNKHILLDHKTRITFVERTTGEERTQGIVWNPAGICEIRDYEQEAARPNIAQPMRAPE